MKYFTTTRNTTYRITSDPKILGGKPVIKGTRIAVDFILELLSSGMTEKGILKEYPQLERDDIRAAMSFAAKTLEREEVVFVR